jgi:hypothetical protein
MNLSFKRQISKGWKKLRSRILHIITRRFKKPDGKVIFFIQLRTKDLPDDVADIFGGRV